MTLTLDTDVIAEDIAAGVPASGSLCPIALAAKRTLAASHPHISGVHVGDDWMGLTAENHERLAWECDRLPAEAVAFIRAFDTGRGVRPIRLTVEFKECPK